MLEDAQRQLGELEGKLRERDQMKQNQELKIDELMHDLDQSKSQYQALQQKFKAQQENLSTLTATLTETQNELEALVGDHESLGDRARELQELAEKYK